MSSKTAVKEPVEMPEAPGRNPRRWTDPEHTAKYLKSQAAPGGETPTLAERADVQVAYAAALQPRPQDDVRFYNAVFQSTYGRAPRLLREDFAGTFQVAICWAKQHEDCVSHAVDFDGPTIEWGTKNYLRYEPQDVQARVHPLCADVLELPRPGMPLFDVVGANNYSHCTFKTPALMEEYFATAFRALPEEGLFIVDCYGGPESEGTSVEEIASYTIPIGEGVEASFDYVYEQASYDPVTRHQVVKVHFHFEDDSWMRDAFSYEWRVWQIEELRACMTKVGFVRTGVFIDDFDENMNYRHNLEPEVNWQARVEDEDFYSSYIVGYKS